MKYNIAIQVDAVLLEKDNPSAISEAADLLQDVKHYFNEEGLIIQDDNGNELEVIPYGWYLVKEEHGISAIHKDKFEVIAVPVTQAEMHE